MCCGSQLVLVYIRSNICSNRTGHEPKGAWIPMHRQPSFYPPVSPSPRKTLPAAAWENLKSQGHKTTPSWSRSRSVFQTGGSAPSEEMVMQCFVLDTGYARCWAGFFVLFIFLHLLEESMEETWVSSFQTCLGEVSSACDMKTTTLLHLQFTWKEEALWDIKQIDSRPYLDGCFILLCVGPWLFMHACVDLGT